MIDLKRFREGNVVLLPNHHERRFPVPMRHKAALRAPKGSPFRLVRMTATRAFATGAPFFREARRDTSLFGLVPQVVFDPARLHLGNFLPNPAG